MGIKINNLKFQYSKKDRFVLDDISFEIEEGNVCLLLGLNGCGKTTLIKNIVGLYKPTYGNILIDNEDINKMTIQERSKKIAYVSQKINYLYDIKIKDYLTYGMYNEMKFFEKPSDEHYKKVLKYANDFGISNLIDKTIDQISGGERQIVSIVASLLQNTSIIVLDEPTSALDLKNQNMVLSVLNRLAKEENKTIILSSHNPNHALYLNSKVALINDGKVVKYGIACDLINIDNLKNIYGDNICLSSELNYKEISFR